MQKSMQILHVLKVDAEDNLLYAITQTEHVLIS